MKIKAVLERIKRALGEIIDNWLTLFQFKAEKIGYECNCTPEVVANFTEEVIRGSIFFALSAVIKKIEPMLRGALGEAKWLVISPVREVSGKVVFEKALRNVPLTGYKESVVLLTEKIGGEEEVPSGIKAVILVNTTDYPDVLAHVSVRARNNKVLLAVSFNEDNTKSLFNLVDSFTKIKHNGNDIEILKCDKPVEDEKSETSEGGHYEMALKPCPKVENYIISQEQFTPSLVGAKSNNLGIIRGKVLDWINLPESIALQFGTMEHILKGFPGLHSEITTLQESLNEKNFSSILAKLRQIVVEKLPFPDSPKGIEMKEQLMKFGITDIESAWKSIKEVFASKFNERAYIATRKLGITLEKIYMAVLVQKVINSEYSFVIHSKNPMSNNEDELYGEIAVGLGEALVGSYAGQSLSFSFHKKNGTTKVLTLPNKTFCLKSQGGYMFRSDSNTEDLEGFAGAGLFDSIPSASFVRQRVSYANEKLINDSGFRDYFMKQLSVIGENIEKIYDGKPQDIEGCYSEGKFYVVQTRPQV